MQAIEDALKRFAWTHGFGFRKTSHLYGDSRDEIALDGWSGRIVRFTRPNRTVGVWTCEDCDIWSHLFRKLTSSPLAAPQICFGELLRDDPGEGSEAYFLNWMWFVGKGYTMTSYPWRTADEDVPYFRMYLKGEMEEGPFIDYLMDKGYIQ